MSQEKVRCCADTLLKEIHDAHYDSGMLSRFSNSVISSAMQLFFKSLIDFSYSISYLDFLTFCQCLVPNVFQILQDYGLFYTYLGILPSDVRIEERVLVEFSIKVGEISGTNARMKFMDTISIRLQHVQFFIDLYARCCENLKAKYVEKNTLKVTLESFENAIELNRNIQTERLENFPIQTE